MTNQYDRTSRWWLINLSADAWCNKAAGKALPKRPFMGAFQMQTLTKAGYMKQASVQEELGGACLHDGVMGNGAMWCELQQGSMQLIQIWLRSRCANPSV